MKKLLSALCILFFVEATTNAHDIDYSLESETAFAIDSTDTVYFDLSKAMIVGNQLVLPVGIMTGQPVNSLDFSLKYDHAELDYDTIMNLTTYLQGLSYYNPTDSAVRYTSNSFSAIGVGVNLVNVYFNLIGNQINNADFSDVKGYLNGVKCTAIILNQLSVGLAESIKINAVNLYPNPASEMITLASEESDVFVIRDIQGRTVSGEIKLNAGEKISVSVSGLTNGIYFLQAVRESSSMTRFVVQR